VIKLFKKYLVDFGKKYLHKTAKQIIVNEMTHLCW